MTREEIYSAINTEIQRNVNDGKEPRFITGKLNGMVKAFKIAGLLDPDDDMVTEIMKEL